MALEKLNEWLGLLANLGVFAGLVFLAVEIQQSNRIAVGTAESGWTLQASEVNRSVVENEVTAKLAGKLSTPNPKLTVAEEAQAKFFARQFSNLWTSAARLHANGLMEDTSFAEAVLDVEVTLRELPGLAPHIAYLYEVYKVQPGASAISDAVFSGLSKMENVKDSEG